MIFSELEYKGKAKWNNQKVISLVFISLNRSKMDLTPSGVPDVLMEFFPYAEGYFRVTTVGLNPTNPQYSGNVSHLVL